jgi:hypothetical protein
MNDHEAVANRIDFLREKNIVRLRLIFTLFWFDCEYLHSTFWIVANNISHLHSDFEHYCMILHDSEWVAKKISHLHPDFEDCIPK